jgi:copper(I)-binding protein
MTGSRPSIRFAAFGAGGAFLLALLVGCGGSSGPPAVPSAGPSASAATVTGADSSAGAIQIRAARIPQPASPDVAAAYLTIINTGASPDALVRASTPAAASVSLHETTESSGVERMVPLSTIPVPAHGTVAMTAGEMHLMLMNPPAALRAGDTVTLTLVFQHAGTVSVAVPVVPLTGFGATPETSGSGHNMNDMPGMG